MKTRSVTLIKIIKTGYIVISLTFCAIGIMFIADPDVSARNLITLLGICMIVFGAVKIVGYFSRDLFRLAFQYDLELGVILAITGIAVLTWPAGSVTVIFTALGIDALADALFKLRIAIDAKRFGIDKWWITLAFGAVTAVLGLLLVIRPLDTARAMIVLTGIVLCAEGVLNLCSALSMVKIIKHQYPDDIEIKYSETENPV